MCRGLRAAEASSHSSAGQKSEISMSAGLVLLEVLLRTVPHLLSASEGACVARGSCFGDASLQLGPPCLWCSPGMSVSFLLTRPVVV